MKSSSDNLISDIDTLKIGIFDPDGKNPNPLTNKEYSDTYKKLAEKWKTLPAYEMSQDILKSIENFQLTFIISSTGSGKTVLIPKFSLHYTKYKGKVAVTLPKRSITVNNAAFAADTLDVKLGSHIGYVHKNSDTKMVSDENKILYMTDGTLVAKMMRDPLLTEFDVVVIDEAHERKTQIDLILLYLKNLLLSGQRPDIRIVIMSATINADKYQKYFENIDSNIITISGIPNYDIETYFLNESSKSYIIEGINLLNKLIESKKKEDILFFVTTSNEAKQLCRTIKPKWSKVYCIEVYAEMNKKLEIYAKSPTAYKELGNYDQKLIIATNVAESSLTIDGLDTVIDSGYELYGYFDPKSFSNVLEKRLITKAQAMQRRGRVGRTRPGKCYHLLTEYQFDNLKMYPDPDILTTDITIVLLQIINTTTSRTFDEGLYVLNQLLDTPYSSYINAAKSIYDLYELLDESGKINKIALDIINFSSIPINRILFIIYSFQLRCASEASIIVATIDAVGGNIRKLFKNPESGKNNNPLAEEWIEKYSSTESDHLTIHILFEQYFKETDKKEWANKNGINLVIIRNIRREASKLFHKMLTISRAPQLERVSNTDVKKRLLVSLKKSHQHQIATKSRTTFPIVKVFASIDRNSIIANKTSTRNHIKNKSLIYDELTRINGKYSFNTVTLI